MPESPTVVPSSPFPTRRRAAHHAHRDVTTLFGLLALLTVVVGIYRAPFVALMAREGRPSSWITSVYWTLQLQRPGRPRPGGARARPPAPETRLPSGAELMLIADAEAEQRFFERYPGR
jgi:hypothetical protein